MLQVRVRDNGEPVLSGLKSFTVIVNPLGPVLLTPVSFAGGQFQFDVNGPTGPDYIAVVSTNLTQWSDIFTNLAPATPFRFNDSAVGTFPSRVYRVRLGP